jgi:hypothetical protein
VVLVEEVFLSMYVVVVKIGTKMAHSQPLAFKIYQKNIMGDI